MPLLRLLYRSMQVHPLFTRFYRGLIVSCQALPDEPLYGSAIMAAMACAAKMGGAAGIRANTPQDIAAIRAVVDLPIIGLYKIVVPGYAPYITPTMQAAEAASEAGADIITVHVEDKATAVASLDIIRKAGKRGGLAIRLDTPLEELIPYFDEIELVLMMGTQLGVKGQGLAYNACDRIRAMRRMIREHGYAGRIAIFADGGIRLNTVPDLRAAGADGIVPGSLVFGSEDIAETIAWLHGLPQPEEGEDGGAQ